MSNIPLLKVHVPPEADSAMLETLHSGNLATGVKTDQFEKEFGEFIGNPHCIATNSASSAILLALHLAGIQEGDEVVSDPLTCLSVNESILALRAKIVWADIDPKNGNIDPESIRNKISSRTKAIVYSHWVGRLANIEVINQLASHNGLAVIEDAASALGGESNGRKVGNGTADYTIFSFGAVKQITTGDGGMLAVKNAEERQRAILMRNHGNDRLAKRTPFTLGFDVFELGYKFAMNDVAATLGLTQLSHIPRLLDLYSRNLGTYEKELKNTPGIQILEEYEGVRSVPWVFTVLANDREGLVKKLQESGVGCGIVHMRNDSMALFKGFKTDLPHLDWFDQRFVNLPVGWWVKPEDIQQVSKIINSGW